ncbi:MAG: hypothetical protein KJ718_02455 [Nanoarchaeota archaeon]|nr:hypothetical protein [Nanoarchaeota archaeon]
MVRAFIDIRPGDTISIKPNNLELMILNSNSQTLNLQISGGRKLSIPEGANAHLSTGISLHNYGHRGMGKAYHIRLTCTPIIPYTR